MRFADLHLHTYFSDGTFSPQELINEAAKAGLSAIAVCDHDIVEGVDPAIEAAEKEGIEVLSGVELTAEEAGSEIHILGYLFDHKSQELKTRLQELRERRVERVYKIVDKLNGLGLPLSADKVFEIAKNGSVGRLHIARAMLASGLVSSIYEAFQKYIGDKGPAYVLGFRFTPKEAIKLIKCNGGIPVIAHPYSLDNDELIPEFVGLGLMGIEVYYPEHSQSMINFYLDLAKKYNLLVTGGSDCHGKAKPEVKIGSIKLPYEFVEKLKSAKPR